MFLFVPAFEYQFHCFSKQKRYYAGASAHAKLLKLMSHPLKTSQNSTQLSMLVIEISVPGFSCSSLGQAVVIIPNEH